MLAVEAELLLGTYRADPSGDAITDRSRGEWPPAPSRVLAALIAAGGGPEPHYSELVEFAAAQPPTIYADPKPHSQPLHGRFVAQNANTKSTHHEYPARNGRLVKPGTRMSPRDRRVVFLYPDLNPTAETVAALQWRAARVGYLGCGDSPVATRIRLVESPPDGPAFIPDPDGSVSINTHTKEHVAAWCAAFEAWTNRGINRRRFMILRHQTAYRSPTEVLDPATDGGQVIAWMSFNSSIPGRKASAIAHVFKSATYSRYQQLHSAVPPNWLHGHDIPEGNGDWQLVRFLPLPNVGHQHADGRIHGLAVWLPPGATETETRRIAEAVRAVTNLAGITDGVAIADPRNRRSLTTSPKRWTAASRQWATALPVVSDRYGPARRLGADDVARWCQQAGLPKPVAARVSKTPLTSGGVDLSRPETARPGHQQPRPWAHVEMFFAEHIRGPVAIGAARSYGLGLCVPVEETLRIEP